MSEPRRWDGKEDRGTVTLFAALLAISLLLVTGIVVDGGRLLNRYVEAHDLATNAARAGAQGVDTGVLYAGGDPQVADGLAAAAVAAYMEGRGGTVTAVEVAGNQVVVEVQLTQSMIMLGSLGGVGSDRTVTARASATAVRGVEAPS